MTIDYRASQDEPPRRAFFSPTAFLVVAVPIVLVYAMLFLFLPRIERMYADFGTKLPAATQIVLNMARFAQSWGYAPAVAIPVAAGLLVPRFARRSTTPRSTRLLVLLFINFVALILIFVAIIVVMLPWYQMMDNISGNP